MAIEIALLLLLPQAAPPQGPVQHWRVDEAAGPTANDGSSGGANDGTWGGTPVPSTDRPTLQFTNPQSLGFNGTDAQVTRATVTGIAAGNTPHTIAMWIKVNALPANRAWIALLGAEGAGAHHWLITSAGVTQFGVWNGTQKAPVLAADGAWRHVASTFNGTNLSCYVNGVEVGTPAAATFNFSGVPFSVAQQHLGENYFNGILDDVRVYARALTTAEVQYLAAGNGPLAAPQNPAATPGIQSITLTWQPVAGAASYTIRRTTSLSDPNPPVIASGVTGTSYTDNGLDSSTRYYYVVTAVHSIGDESPFSIVADAVPLPIPPRTEGHDEGLLGDNCSCGSSVPAAAPGALWAAALIALAARSRRRRGSRPA